VYVTEIDPETNVITVGPRDELLRQTLLAGQINMIKYERLDAERPVDAKIRYNDSGAPGIAWQENDELRVAFSRPRSAITPGQSVVLYEKEDVIGGGWIHSVGERGTIHDESFIELQTV
jgi:tRNA-specific 2-thiouridylase